MVYLYQEDLVTGALKGKFLQQSMPVKIKSHTFGICLGMQTAVPDFARSRLGVQDASSTEFHKDTKSLYVIFMPEGSKTHMGGTMRLGSRRTYFQVKDCTSAKLYGNASFVDERHRHRYEVNADMVAQLENAGMSFTGKDETGERMEIIELPDHPFFIGGQFHPEFKSRPGKPSPLFIGLIAAAIGQLDAVLGSPLIVQDSLKTERPKYKVSLPSKSNGSVHPEYPYSNGSVNGLYPEHDNGSLDGVYSNYSKGCSLNGIHKDQSNGTNGAYSDRVKGSYSNGNGLHY